MAQEEYYLDRVDRVVYYTGDRIDRADGPAVIYKNGRVEYWRRGLRHRAGDKPAVIDPVLQIQEYWVEGKRHRLHGPAIIKPNETSYWQDNKLHRGGDLPAVIRGTRIEYWLHGRRHRKDGLPAVYDPDLVEEYWVNGVRVGGGPGLTAKSLKKRSPKAESCLAISAWYVLILWVFWLSMHMYVGRS